MNIIKLKYSVTICKFVGISINNQYNIKIYIVVRISLHEEKKICLYFGGAMILYKLTGGTQKIDRWNAKMQEARDECVRQLINREYKAKGNI
jgi:hypothetical protein